MKTFYVYRITFVDDTYYIGYRGSSQAPSEDLLIKYHTSSKKVKIKLPTCSHTATILHEGLNKEDAYHIEQEIIFEHISDPLCLNERCYRGRDGFGILTESARQKISKTNKEKWANPEYRNRVVQSHKLRWENSDLKEKQSARLSGIKRSEHSKKMKGRSASEDTKQKLRKPKHPGHGKAVSIATKGVPKSEAHKEKLRGSKPRVCRLIDRKEMSVNHYTRWLNSLLSQEKEI